MEAHRCRFVDYVPPVVTALAATPASVRQTLVAVGRENGTIEVRNPRFEWFPERVIPGGENRGVSTPRNVKHRLSTSMPHFTVPTAKIRLVESDTTKRLSIL